MAPKKPNYAQDRMQRERAQAAKHAEKAERLVEEFPPGAKPEGRRDQGPERRSLTGRAGSRQGRPKKRQMPPVSSIGRI